MTPNIPLQAWAPDVDPTTPGVMTDVSSLLPTVRGYAADYAATGSGVFPGVTFSSRALSGQLCEPSGPYNPITLISTSRKIYRVEQTLVDLSRGGGLYTPTSISSPWRFAAFGDEIVATQSDNTFQRLSAGGTAFVDVTGGPKARTIAVQSNFIMCASSYYDTNWPYTDGYWCSALGSSTNWTPDVATQCVRGRLTQTPGAIVRVIAFQNDLIFFKPSSVIRATYVGAPQVWQFTVLSSKIGLVGHSAVCEAEGVLYWCGYDGFYRFDGASIQRIASAPWRWMTETSVDLLLYGQHASTVWDPSRRVVRWYFMGKDPYVNGELALNVGVAYHPDTDRWGKFSCQATVVTALNYEVLPMVNAPDTIQFTPNAPCVVDVSTNALQTYSGTPAASSFTTGDIGDDDNAYTLRRVRARFLRAPTSSSATQYTRMNLDESLVTRETIARTDGKYDLTHNARWHRVKFSQTGMYEVAGFSVDTKQGGTR